MKELSLDGTHMVTFHGYHSTYVLGCRCKLCLDAHALYTSEKNNTPVRKRKSRDTMLKSNYGISIEQYEEILVSQQGVCWICEKTNGRRSLAVDHNHNTGQIRGLLCSKCNIALGYVDEDPDILEKMISYLKIFNT